MALRAAQEAMTLLKNQNNILPLSKDKKVLIAGPSGNSIAPLNGCWSYTWQGKDEQWYPSDDKTIVQAMMEKSSPSQIVVLGAKGFMCEEFIEVFSVKNRLT